MKYFIKCWEDVRSNRQSKGVSLLQLAESSSLGIKQGAKINGGGYKIMSCENTECRFWTGWSENGCKQYNNIEECKESKQYLI